MKTSTYPHYQCSFSEFNVAQSGVVPFFDQDVNLVVSFSTATGKTAIAECVFGYHLANSATSKVVYISPFKGIASERLRNWSNDPQFCSCGLLVCTSDNRPTDVEYESARIFIMTSESFDFRSRAAERWLGKVECVVFDEAHLIGDESRGAAMEASIMRLTALNPKARVVLLSATMANAVELAKWVKSLNGKQTKCARSSWRPIKLNFRYHEYDDSGDWGQRNLCRLAAAVESARPACPGEKVLVFVHSKQTGKEVMTALRRSGVRCGFHNAALAPENREMLERLFDDPYSGVDVLVSTSTLSAGVNLG